jgi:hypothetical protein
MPTSTALRLPAASMTAVTSSILCSSVGATPGAIGSDSPVPRLSNTMKRPSELMRRTKRRHWGCSQSTSMWDAIPGTRTMSSGPSPMTW